MTRKPPTQASRRAVFSRRALILNSGMVGAGLVLAGRMGWLSVLERDKYHLLAEDNRISVRMTPPRRGWIVDRRGQPLALNEPDYRLELIPEQAENIEESFKILGRIIQLSPEKLDRLRQKIPELPGAVPVIVTDKLTWKEFATINVHLPQLPGFTPDEGFARSYPRGPEMAHLLGYVGTPTREQYEKTRNPLYIMPGFQVGKNGVERTLEKKLQGQPGAQRVEINAHGRVLRSIDTLPDTPGQTVRLTIDRALQTYAARRLGAQSASVVVMDCETGDILTMASMPAFDPNVFSDGISQKLWDRLLKDERHPLINKSVQGLYPPGSTFKPITALAALRAGTSPEWTCTCTGTYALGNHIFHCWKRNGHGVMNAFSAMEQSCDVYYYTLAHKMGISPIADVGSIFGMGEEIALPLPHIRSGLMPTPAWKKKRFNKPWFTGETLNAAIGQGYTLTTPLQLALMTARIASGKHVMPRLLYTAPTKDFAPLDMSGEWLDVVREGMYRVVNGDRGTARGSRPLSKEFIMAGKTGTAQVRRISMAERRQGLTDSERLPWRFRDHALFIAYAPVEKPRYACAVIVEHGMHGSTAAAPIARDVLTSLIDPKHAKILLDAQEKQRRAQGIATEEIAEAQSDQQISALHDALARLG